MSSTQAPQITVLVPVYNVERYLRECLDSIRAQTFADFEAICINDGSTDASRDIIQEYLDTDARFRVIDKPNSGYGASMNMGLDAARGSYIAILESDDLYMPTALEALHDAAVECDAQVVKGEFNLYWSEPEKRILSGELARIPLRQMLVPSDVPEIFYVKSSIWSALYERKFLVDNAIRFLETPGASYQDTSFNFKVWLHARRAVFIEDVILDYRQDNEQSSVNSAAKAHCVCDEYDEIERWLEMHDAPDALTGIMLRAKYNNYLWNYDRLVDDLRAEFLERFSAEFRKDMEADRVDLSRFEPWAEADLKALVSSPETFRKCRDDVRSPGKLNTFKHYYRLGGLSLIVKVLKYKREQR